MIHNLSHTWTTDSWWIIYFISTKIGGRIIEKGHLWFAQKPFFWRKMCPFHVIYLPFSKPFIFHFITMCGLVSFLVWQWDYALSHRMEMDRSLLRNKTFVRKYNEHRCIYFVWVFLCFLFMWNANGDNTYPFSNWIRFITVREGPDLRNHRALLWFNVVRNPSVPWS